MTKHQPRERVRQSMMLRSHVIRATALLCAGLLAMPAAAVEGEILINQAKVNAGGITPGDTAGFPATISRAGPLKAQRQSRGARRRQRHRGHDE